MRAKTLEDAAYMAAGKLHELRAKKVSFIPQRIEAEALIACNQAPTRENIQEVGRIIARWRKNRKPTKVGKIAKPAKTRRLPKPQAKPVQLTLRF